MQALSCSLHGCRTYVPCFQRILARACFRLLNHRAYDCLNLPLHHGMSTFNINISMFPMNIRSFRSMASAILSQSMQYPLYGACLYWGGLHTLYYEGTDFFQSAVINNLLLFSRKNQPFQIKPILCLHYHFYPNQGFRIAEPPEYISHLPPLTFSHIQDADRRFC